MRIVHVVFNLRSGGLEYEVADLATYQAKMGNQVSVVIINRDNDPYILELAGKYAAVHTLNRPEGSINPTYILKLNRLLWKLNPDIVHNHFRKSMGMILKRSNTTYVMTYHDTEGNPGPSLRADMLTGVSDDAGAILASVYGRKVTTVGNGIPIGKIRRKAHVFEAGRRIVCPARLYHDVKGQHLLIEAISMPGLEKVTVDFIGAGPSLDFLERIAERLGVASRIRFIGQLRRDELYDRLAGYDVMVLPSLREGFGLVIAEADAAGLRVVVPDLQPTLATSQYASCRFVFRTGDNRSLSDSIMRAISEPYTGIRSQNHHFAIERIAKQYCRLYEEYRREG